MDGRSRDKFRVEGATNHGTLPHKNRIAIVLRQYTHIGSPGSDARSTDKHGLQTFYARQ